MATNNGMATTAALNDEVTVSLIRGTSCYTMPTNQVTVDSLRRLFHRLSQNIDGKVNLPETNLFERVNPDAVWLNCEINDTAFLPTEDGRFVINDVHQGILLNVEGPLLITDFPTNADDFRIQGSRCQQCGIEKSKVVAYLDQLDYLLNKIRSQVK